MQDGIGADEASSGGPTRGGGNGDRVTGVRESGAGHAAVRVHDFPSTPPLIHIHERYLVFPGVRALHTWEVSPTAFIVLVIHSSDSCGLLQSILCYQWNMIDFPR